MSAALAAPLASSLATPAEWAGLLADEQAVYLAALNGLGLRLLAERLAGDERHQWGAQLARWFVQGLITAADVAAARDAL